MKKLISQDLAYCTLLALGWRIMLQLYATFAIHRFHLSDVSDGHWYLLHIWQNFDGHHYISIAQKGYEFVEYAWFPLYPIAIKILAMPLALIFGDHVSIYVLSGVLVSTLGLIFALYFLLQLARHYFNEEVGKNAIFLLLFFPTAVFLGAAYTEGFFLMWTMGAFYFALKRQWLWAGIFGFADAATRLVGLALFPALLLQFYLTPGISWRKEWIKAWPLLLIPCALLLYMIYQWVTVGNPLQFFDVQQLWGREINAGSASRVLQDIRTGLTDFRAQNIGLMMDAVAIIFGLVCVGILTYKKYFSFALYTFLVIIVPLSSGETTGMIRYLLAGFPIFLLLGQWARNHTIYSVFLTAFSILFALLSIHFFNNWWLA